MYSIGTLNKNTTTGILLRILIIIDKILSFIKTNPIILEIVFAITIKNTSSKALIKKKKNLSLKASFLNADTILLIIDSILYCSFHTSPLIDKPVVNNKNKT